MKPFRNRFPLARCGALLALCWLIADRAPAFDAAGDPNASAPTLGLQPSAVPAREMRGWRPPKKIVVLIDTPARLQWLRESVADTGVEVIGAKSPAQFLASVEHADGVEGLCSAALVAADPDLRWIQTQGAGVDGCVSIPRVASGDIILTNMQKVDAANVAEHAFALILALSRQLPDWATAQSRHSWDPRLSHDMLDLEGSTLLIVGLGGNGTAIAQRAHAFGMHVIATRARDTAAPDFVEHVGLPTELPDLATRADVIVNTTPLTPQTDGLFDAAMFARMKSTALFINVGRGKSVVTADLVRALQRGQIAGAGLDVVDPEPLPASNPLWRAPHVVITPHVADRSPQRMQRFWVVMRENLRRYAHGENLLSLVDPQRGY